MTYNVFVLEIVTKYDLEDTEWMKGRIIKQMKCWVKPGFHAKRQLKFVLVTDETIEMLYSRLGDFLFDLRDSGSIERFAISDAPMTVITDHGQFDPFTHYLRLGRVHASERNQSQRLRNRQRR